MSLMGHFHRIDPLPTLSACPLRSDRVGTLCTAAKDAKCQKEVGLRIKKHGGEFFMQLPNYPGVDAEKKFKDINGIVFDVSEHGWG